MTKLDKVYREILARAPEHDFDPTLGRVHRALDLLGEPQRAYQVIHVAGTNGKTTTARVAESLVRAHGLRTGLFTSPHLAQVSERIAIDGEPIGEDAFLEAWRLVEPVVAMVDAESRAATPPGPAMSFFEVLTVLGFVAFADAPVDVAVVEVGMGGVWDATKVVASQVQVITPVARDHTKWLGQDIAEIAREKAGIIGSGPVFIGRQRDDVAAVLEKAVLDAGATAYWQGENSFDVVAREIAVGGQMVTLRGLGGEYRELFLPLHGAHQADNAACALAAVECLLAEPGRPLGPDLVEEGLAEVKSRGRLEVVANSPTVLVDAAHNYAGAEALAQAVTETFPFDLVGLVGILDDKDAEAILGALEPVLDQVVVTASSSPRAIPPRQLGQVACDVFGEDRVEVVERLDDALARAMDLAALAAGNAPGPLAPGVLATGSITLVAEVRTLLRAP
jgi:dihydrofolate synthase/folylpolyglutamate synthase